MPLSGMLPIAKPIGPTSFDVVAAVRRFLDPPNTPFRRRSKVGHAGTLDPFAEGVLLILIGSATRLTPYLHQVDKTYEATLKLGAATDTDDNTGRIIAEVPVPHLPEQTLLEQTLQKQFTGTIRQIPPIYSALKQDGKRLYDLARAGQTPQPAAREVRIDTFELLQMTDHTLTFRVTCSTGTYIRALGRDIAEYLGTKGHLKQLVRTSIGPFSLKSCIPLTNLSREALQAQIRPIRGPQLQMPEIQVTTEEQNDLLHGRAIERTLPVSNTDILAMSENDEAIAVCRQEGSKLSPRVVLLKG